MSEQPAEHIDNRIRAIDGFDPRRFLTRVSGQDYLEVKWRLLWLRTFDPDATIRTELFSNVNQSAVVHATVTLSPDKGGGSASGYGSETYDDFRDYLEKAETKAIGRALAALGFGTQFTNDYDLEQGTDRLADAPVRRPNPRPAQSVNSTVDQQQPQRSAQPGSGITDRQISFIHQMNRDKGYSSDALNRMIQTLFGKSNLDQLDRRDASSLIERLKTVPPKNEPDPEHEPVVNQATGEIMDVDEIPF